MAELHSGLENKEFWYQDIILVCNQLPDFEREEVDLTSQFSRNIKLKTPFVSSPMDTVTGAEMAILMASMGGIGVIHYNYETIEEQIEEAKKVKRFDENKQLKVLIAVESRLALAKERMKKGAEAGIDGLVIDASIVFKEQLKIAQYAKKNFPQLEVILGNIDSGKMVTEIVKKAGKWVDGLRVGIGPGEICTTQKYLGVGRAQASAVWDCAQAAKKAGIPIIADGGIRKPADITKALALGAQTVMMGSLLAGLEESPGEAEFDENRGGR